MITIYSNRSTHSVHRASLAGVEMPEVKINLVGFTGTVAAGGSTMFSTLFLQSFPPSRRFLCLRVTSTMVVEGRGHIVSSNNTLEQGSPVLGQQECTA